MKNYTGLKNNMLTAVKHINNTDKKTYWLFNCECGNEKILIASKVLSKNSTTKSCGCLRLSINSENPSINYLINSYKKGAKKRNLNYQLSLNFFIDITSKKCFYCGVLPYKSIKRYGYSYLYNGIDRVDNNLGYIEENVVTCCELCNKSKRNLDYQVFINWIKRLSIYQSKHFHL